jgi:hypothetical protein
MVGCGGLRHRGTPREQNGGLFRPFRCALQYGPKAGREYGPKRLKNMKSFPESRAGHVPAAAAARLRADAAGAGADGPPGRRACKSAGCAAQSFRGSTVDAARQYWQNESVVFDNRNPQILLRNHCCGQ